MMVPTAYTVEAIAISSIVCSSICFFAPRRGGYLRLSFYCPPNHRQPGISVCAGREEGLNTFLYQAAEAPIVKFSVGLQAVVRFSTDADSSTGLFPWFFDHLKFFPGGVGNTLLCLDLGP